MTPTVRARPFALPAPEGIPGIGAAITPAAKRGAAHVAGEAKGGRLIYVDLNAFAWWYGGGWLTLNRGRRGLARAHRGAEDATQIRR